VWTIPEDAKAYLLDLLQGGGISLHINYINLLYRILHDVAESPRAAFGGSDRDLSGGAVIYDGDWNLLLSGKDSDGNYKLWSLIYGDGSEQTADTWSELKEFASAPSDGDYQYRCAFIDKPDVRRCFFAEKFTGSEAYSRPSWSYSVPGAGYGENLWHEPVPFNLSSEYGLAIAHHGDYCWLSSPGGVWRASLAEESLELTASIIAVKLELSHREGRLTLELDNSQGRFASPGEGELKPLEIGCQIAVSPGYVTEAGSESSPGLSFAIDGREHTSAAGEASLIIHASDGWSRAGSWAARQQFRWNKSGQEMSIKEIIAFVLARAGIGLEAKSQSAAITGDCPDFTINPSNRGEGALRKLLSLVPDMIFIEGGKAYIINPSADDDSVYSYGCEHPVLEGRCRRRGWEINRVQVEGYDPVGDEPIVVESFSWDGIARLYDRLTRVEDRNIDTVSRAGQRGEAYLRRAEIASVGGVIRIAPNCGQQLYDVIDITDPRAGLSEDKRRVTGLTLVYDPRRGEYHQRLELGMP